MSGEVDGKLIEKGTDNSVAAWDWSSIFRKQVERWEDQHECGSSKDRVQFYNDNILDYERVARKNEHKGPVYTALAVHKLLQGDRDKSVLDVGCGQGHASSELRKLGDYNNIDGLDPAKEFLEYGHRKGLYREIFNIYFYNGCEMEENSYDILCCSGGMAPGHIKSESLREMWRIVKPGGFVVIVMGVSGLLNDEDLRKVRPVIADLVQEKKWEVVEDYQVDDYGRGSGPGQVFVFKKLAAM